MLMARAKLDEVHIDDNFDMVDVVGNGYVAVE